MFLKSIELFGFKSFSDKSKIDFGDGISVVVGPNGCGKSNIVDSLRWVLGAQSAKGMRIEKMADVIFSGTDQRHPLNIAEVTFTLSNDNNILPLEFSEIAVKRRVFRNGTSEYYINKNQVSLKELRMLLADTGMGMSGYMVMEQGRIDQILEAKPEVRRVILEEAAGIVKYRTKSIESANRLDKVRINIQQVQQILSEVEKQYQTLKIQSEKALQYHALKDEMFVCETQQTCLQYHMLTTQLEKQGDALEKINEKVSAEEQVLSKMKQDTQAFHEAIKSQEQQLAEHQQSAVSISTEQRVLSDYIQSQNDVIEELKRQIESERLHCEHLVVQSREYIQEKEALTIDRDKQKQNIIDVDDRIKKTKEHMISQEKKVRTLQDNRYSLQQREEHNRIALEEYQKELRSVVDRLAEELDKQISQTGYSASVYNTLENELVTLYGDINKTIDAMTHFLSDATKVGDTVKVTDVQSHVTILQNTIKVTNEKFSEFCGVAPTFLNEFLSSDGVLSHKHVIDKKINDLIAEQTFCREDAARILTEIQTLQKDISTLKENVHELTLEKNTYNQKLAFIDTQESRISETITSISEQIKRQETQIEGYNLSVKNKHQEYVVQTKKHGSLETQYKKISNTIASLQEKIASHYSKAGVYTDNISIQNKKISDAQQKLKFIEQKIAEIRTRRQVTEETFRDTHGELLAVYLSQKQYQVSSDTNKDFLQQKLQNIRRQIKDLGQINLLAAEEFVLVEERYNFLTSQITDLNTAEKDLDTVLKEIEKESRKKLQATYVEVRKHFRSLFTRLMGGGTADIIFTDEQDILNAGLEITAQPPEKKTQFLSQLSGGERALIAVALLFAIHSVKPAPFCVLDEIDAPLDDKNVDSLMELLHSFKDVTQFVIISHNKRTIAHAKNLIGVTMEERGVSKIIGVKMEGQHV